MLFLLRVKSNVSSSYMRKTRYKNSSRGENRTSLLGQCKRLCSSHTPTYPHACNTKKRKNKLKKGVNLCCSEMQCGRRNGWGERMQCKERPAVLEISAGPHSAYSSGEVMIEIRILQEREREKGRERRRERERKARGKEKRNPILHLAALVNPRWPVLAGRKIFRTLEYGIFLFVIRRAYLLQGNLYKTSMSKFEALESDEDYTPGFVAAFRELGCVW